MIDYNEALRFTGLRHALCEIFEPQRYLVTDLSDFQCNRGAIVPTNKIIFIGRGLNGLAFVDVGHSCVYDSFDLNRGALNDSHGSIDVALDSLPVTLSAGLTQGARLHQVVLQYDTRSERVYLSSFDRSPGRPRRSLPLEVRSTRVALV